MAMKDDCIRWLQLKRKSVALSLKNINFGYFIIESIRREDTACMHFGPIVSRWPRVEVVKERHWERVYAFSPKYGDVISIRLSDSSDNDVYQWRERFSKLKTTWFLPPEMPWNGENSNFKTKFNT